MARAATKAPPRATPGSSTRRSVDQGELARFAATARSWWDPSGPYRALHRLNAVRIAYVRDHLCARFGRDAVARRPLVGLRVLDIGCGGGLLAEPLTRLGAAVLGADAVAENIDAARLHAEECGLDIDYRCATAEQLAEDSEPFDAVLMMEVIEHVADREAFLAACGALVKPGGTLVFATLNRTIKAYALAILGAEYVLGWLPRGSHSWEKFVRPAELARSARRHGLVLEHLSGVAYSPLAGGWRLSGDTAVNYMGVLVKQGSTGTTRRRARRA